MKKVVIISIFVALFVGIEAVFLLVWHSLRHTPDSDIYNFESTPAGSVYDTSLKKAADRQRQDGNMSGPDSSGTTAVNFAQKLTILCNGKINIIQRNLSSLESTLANRIPTIDKTVSFVWDKETKEIDVSRCLQARVDNISYDFVLTAYKGHFLKSTNSSYILELQIPSRGNTPPIFKWFLFDASMQYSGRFNLIERGITPPGKIVSIKDYDSDGTDEILFEESEFINQNNYSNPRVMFKVVEGNNLKVVWKETGSDSAGETGRCTGFSKIDFNYNNPPPSDDPKLASIKRVYASKLFSGLPPSIDISGISQKKLIISNSVTCEETKYYISNKTIFSKTLDVYVYSWDINTKEFVYVKKESFNLDLKIKP